MSRFDWDQRHPGIERLGKDLEEDRIRVVAHPLYAQLDSHSRIVTFMEHHVFAIWDYMCLLKSLQRSLTCVQVPWVPSGRTASRRLINELVLVKESDVLATGFISRFELYVEGMDEAGADTTVIKAFIERLREGATVHEALKSVPVPAPSADFVTTNWTLIETAPLHCQAAAFAFGREDLIPDMFGRIVAVREQGHHLDTFVDYLVRHLEVDGEELTPMAMHMLADLCGDDDVKWQQCADTAHQTFDARMRLWDGILAAIQAGSSSRSG